MNTFWHKLTLDKIVAWLAFLGLGTIFDVWESLTRLPVEFWWSLAMLLACLVFLGLLKAIRQSLILETTPASAPPPPPEANPFGDYKPLTETAHFFGRTLLLFAIFGELKKHQNLVLLGDGQIGKSSLLWKVCKQGVSDLPQKQFVYLDMLMVKDEPDFFQVLCEKIGISRCHGDVESIRRGLKNRQYVLCLDAIECMVDSTFFSYKIRNQLAGLAQDKDHPLTLLIASRSPLSDLFPDSPKEASPLANICKNIDIIPFSQEEVSKFIHSRLQPTKIRFTDEEIQTIWETTQGHPKQVQREAETLFDKKKSK